MKNKKLLILMSLLFIFIVMPISKGNSFSYANQKDYVISNATNLAYTNKKGIFHIETFKFDETKKLLDFRGYLIVKDVNNSASSNIKYTLILENQQTKQNIEIELERWLEDIPFTPPNIDGKDYSRPWFKGLIDLTEIPQGDYTLYVKAVVDKKYEAKELVTNVFSKEITRKIEINGRGYLFRTNYYSRQLPIELFVRDNGLLSYDIPPTRDNAMITYTSSTIEKGKLRIRGNTYNIGISYGSNNNVTRKLVLENNETFERFTYDIGYITNGDYQIKLRVPDGKDKTKAWFDAEIDISDLPLGNYSIYVLTTSDGFSDFGELTDIFFAPLPDEDINFEKEVITKLVHNQNKRLRIELVVGYEISCSNTVYEVVYASAISYSKPFKCYLNYNAAKEFMDSMDDFSDKTPTILKNGVVINTRYGLLNLRTKPNKNYNTNMYPTASSSLAYTYINGYSAGDAAFLEYHPTSERVLGKISGYTGWIRRKDGDGQTGYEIVPLSKVLSLSYYYVNNGEIRHRIANKLKEKNSYHGYVRLGPAPDYLEEGKQYYSFDGNYFYNDLKTMLDDYKKGTYENSVNAETPYYNYYQYLPARTKSNYTLWEIDYYLTRIKGFTQKNPDNKAAVDLEKHESMLFNEGRSFFNAQETFGSNMMPALGVSINESASGKSNIAVTNYNVFGHGAIDSNPYGNATKYSLVSLSIFYHNDCYVSAGYANFYDWRYYGSHLGNKASGMNVKYASDPYWGEKAAQHYYLIDKDLGMKDYNYYTIAIKQIPNAVNLRKDTIISTQTVSYSLKEDVINIPVVLIGEATGDSYKGNSKWYRVMSDSLLDENSDPFSFHKDYCKKDSTINRVNYDWDKNELYIHSSFVTIVNTPDEFYHHPKDVVLADSGYEYELFEERKVFKTINSNVVVYDDALLNYDSGKRLQQNKNLLVLERAYTTSGDVAYRVIYDIDNYHPERLTTGWVSAETLEDTGVVNEIYETNKVFKVTNSNVVIYKGYDNYHFEPLNYDLGKRVQQDTYLVVLERAYTDNGDIAYRVIYDAINNKSGWINKDDLVEEPEAKIGKTTNNKIRVRSDAVLNDGNVLATIANKDTPMIILDSKLGEKPDSKEQVLWYKVIYDPINNKTGWIISLYFQPIEEESSE